ncbi:enoyl-CoA hydratase-related protein [Micromonospora sp. DT233]|uniref:enoyl-CoA hydratase-related protein n=1 Tax=Micromonospora sp. DT233 TaxID=3393432 RepID=UPI003CE91005
MELTAPNGTLLLRSEAAVLTVTLARPREQNSITPALMADLHDALDRAEADPACRVVVLRAQGPAFCSGMDLHAAAGSTDDLAAHGGERFLGLLKRLTTVERVVVSCVDGRASGGGVGVVAASDFAYATPASQFGLPEALWGLLPCCVLPFLIRRVGFQRAYTMTLSTLPIDAAEAARRGLVDEVAEDPGPALRRLLVRATKLDPTTIGDLKRYFRRMWIVSDEMEAEALREFGRLMTSPVARERITAFATGQRMPWER